MLINLLGRGELRSISEELGLTRRTCSLPDNGAVKMTAEEFQKCDLNLLATQ